MRKQVYGNAAHVINELFGCIGTNSDFKLALVPYAEITDLTKTLKELGLKNAMIRVIQ